MQRLSRHITKALAVATLVAVAFGPFAPLAQNALAIDALTPGATYQSMGVTGSDAVISQPSTGTVTNATTGKTQTGPAQPTSCSGITDCLANMVYYIGPGFASWVASWAAYFFDFIVRLSLQSGAYSLTFLATCWNLVLSLANMFFIFILIYAAFVIMLRAETARTLQTLAWVIAIALVVNFSFFFTRVVIDAGNILGTQFYNAVAYNKDGTPVGVVQTGGTSSPTTPDITQPIMNALGVEQLLGSNSFSLVTNSLQGSSWSALIVLTVVYVFTAVMFWVLAVALLMVGLKFFLRVVGLWLVLIASPIAFVAQTLSNTRNFFDMWLRTLISFSIYPAVFLFMFWVLDQFVNQLVGGTNSLQSILTSNAAQAANAAAGVGGAAGAANPYPLLVTIANVSIRMMFVITMLYVMLKVSDWIIEQAGGMAGTILNRSSAAILGGGLRSAASFGAFAGRNTAGRVGYNFANSATGKSILANSKLGLGTALWRGANRLGSSTFDARNSTKATAAGGLIGTLSRTRDVNVGRGSQKNRQGTVEEQAARVKAEGAALTASPKEVRAVGKDAARQAERERLDAYIERKTTPNASNLKMPSMGALKGASALQKALDEQRAKEKKAAEKDAKKAAESTPALQLKAIVTPPQPAVQKTTIITSTSSVASNKITDEERAARFAPNPSPTPTTPAPAATAAPMAAPVPAVSTTIQPAAAPAPLAAAASANPAQERQLRNLEQRLERIGKNLGNQIAATDKHMAAKIEENNHRIAERIEQGERRTELKTHDQLAKLEKQVTADLINHRGPDGGGDGKPPAQGAMPKPAEHPIDEGDTGFSKAA